MIIKGQAERPFTADLAWQSSDQGFKLQDSRLNVELYAEQLKFMGLDIENLDLPLAVTGTVASLSATGTVNQGSLQLFPCVDLGSESPVLVFPDDLMLLEGVQLTGELAEGLLSKINPLFSQAAKIQGRMDLLLEQFAWPLKPEQRNQATLSGTLQFEDLHLPEGESLVWQGRI